MRGIDVFYQLCYFLSLNARNAYIQGRREYFVAATVRNECPVRSSKCHFTRPHKCFVVVEDIAIRLPKHKHIDTNSTVHFNLFSRCHWLHMCTESVNQQHLFFKKRY
jgi:hypothetical protein